MREPELLKHPPGDLPIPGGLASHLTAVLTRLRAAVVSDEDAGRMDRVEAIRAAERGLTREYRCVIRVREYMRTTGGGAWIDGSGAVAYSTGGRDAEHRLVPVHRLPVGFAERWMDWVAEGGEGDHRMFQRETREPMVWEVAEDGPGGTSRRGVARRR
ncbi:MAG: hypothetical protein ABIL09_05295 [Gemmatimonadota bacterium]